MSEAVIAYIGLGGNLDNPIWHVTTAFDELNTIENTSLTARSKLYKTRSFLDGQPDYINAVAQVSSQLSARELLVKLFKIENKHGRERKQKWGARTLDLDLLLYADQCINEENLIVPHPYVQERATVLFPLADVNPELIFPNGVSLQQLLTEISPDGIELLKEAVCQS